MTQVNLSEVARRVGLSRQRVRQLVDEDPDFPKPEWVGTAWVVEWSKVERYFAEREPKPGRPPKANGDSASHKQPPRSRRNG
jgi:predicted DNA-binding transcriptional regulator AlpA